MKKKPATVSTVEKTKSTDRQKAKVSVWLFFIFLTTARWQDAGKVSAV
jgi:hypothetical protein